MIRVLVLCLGALVAACAPQIAMAQQKLSNEDMAFALNAYVDIIVEDHVYLESCERPGLTKIEGWEEGAALLIATMSTTDLPEGDIADLRKRLEAPVKAEKPCETLMLPMRVAGIQNGGNWRKIHSNMLKNAFGLKIILSEASLLTAANTVDAVFDKNLPGQKDALLCASVLGGVFFPVHYADWSVEVQKAETLLKGSGLPKRFWSKRIEEARPSAMIGTPDRAALTARCAANPDLMTSLSIFGWANFVPDLEKALTPWIIATQQ